MVKNLMLRHPLQDIPIGSCTVLLGDLGVLIFLVCKTVTCLITILPFCFFLYIKIVALYTSYGDVRSLFVLINHFVESLSRGRSTLYVHIKIVEHVVGGVLKL